MMSEEVKKKPPPNHGRQLRRVFEIDELDVTSQRTMSPELREKLQAAKEIVLDRWLNARLVKNKPTSYTWTKNGWRVNKPNSAYSKRTDRE
jgi:hypothetical protein